MLHACSALIILWHVTRCKSHPARICSFTAALQHVLQVGPRGQTSSSLLSALQVAALAQDGTTWHAAAYLVLSIGSAQVAGLTIYAWVPFTLR